MSAPGYRRQPKQRDVLNPIVLGMCIAPLILGNPFFEKAAWGDTTGTSFPDRQCAVASAKFTVDNMTCLNVGTNAIKCDGYVRVFLPTWSCGKPAAGIRCYAISSSPNYVEYSAGGAAITEKSTAEIAICLGWDLSTASCILSLISMIGGIALGPAGSVITVALVWTGAAGTAAGCLKTAYDLFCNSGCCFLKCRPGEGKPFGVRPWC